MADNESASDKECSACKTRIEALKLLTDWSKWLIALETAAIGGILALLVHFDGRQSELWLKVILVGGSVVALLSFVASILCANLLLASAPDIVQQLQSLPPGTMPAAHTKTKTNLFQVMWWIVAGEPTWPNPTHDIFLMRDPDVDRTVNCLLHGQFWFFLVGIIVSVVSVLIAVVARAFL